MMQEAQYANAKAESSLGTASAVLETRDLRKTYGSGEKSLPVLVNANLILQRGEMVALVAPSGAGKSTLLHLLASLATPTSGTASSATKAIETNYYAALANFRSSAMESSCT